MAAHVFHEIYLHFTWHTQGDLPLLTPQLERDTHAFIRERCAQTEGAYFLGIGGTSTHIHLVVKLEPSIAPSLFLGDLKGAVARAANKARGRQSIRWQRGSGVVSFAKKHVKPVLAYVANQKRRHAGGDLRDALERATF